MRIISIRPGTTEPDADEAEHAFATAAAFRVAAARAIETKVVNDKFQSAHVPAVVCAAFSVELGMKARIISDGNRAEYKKLKGTASHSLLALFHLLSKDDQNWFIEGSGHEKAKFMEALDAVSSAFVDWRYVYEQAERAINFSFLSKLSELATTLPAAP
ncbi:hypothetical protein [Pseudoduganella violacea]|uniref:Uncharacterized protein n=1 Tax=Pseudoduganella violacea TaxID=1715466 RepID=A0A7W5BG29_9BURK|nr:hypothetical protein [Pseudoduganella violacea]MBB3122491.1 hypothetical protein [Pseudoduganella violacea]